MAEHVLSDPEWSQYQDPVSRTVRHSLRGTLDGSTLEATVSEPSSSQLEHREAIRTALGVNFAVELGKRLGVVPESFATTKGR